MLILKLTPQNQPLVIREAVRVLKHGGVIAYPTETTYGFGCDPRNENAIKKIFTIKGRTSQKKVLLVASSIAQVRRVASLVGAALAVALRYWPGPLTLILPSRRIQNLSTRTMEKDGSLAIRVSSSTFVQALTKAYGFPIVSTSANRSGETGARSGRAIINMLEMTRIKPDLVIDAGALPYRKPSTIVRVHEDGTVEILRQGGLRIPHVPCPRAISNPLEARPRVISNGVRNL